MKETDLISKKILTTAHIIKQAGQWRVLAKKIAFTNGVFDILHQGHIFSLSLAAKEADFLIVGLNSDASVKKLKGESRPVNHQDSRSLILASLIMVDAVVIFEQETPLELIKSIMPDVLIKGGDYNIDQVTGAKEVIANGGRVVINPIIEGFSTTGIINQFKNG